MLKPLPRRKGKGQMKPELVIKAVVAVGVDEIDAVVEVLTEVRVDAVE